MTAHRESARSAVQFSMGGLAFFLPYLTALQAACAAGGAVIFNLYLLPRLGPALFRRGERDTPWRSGIVLYPATVFVLIVVFRHSLDVAGAAWAILAAGDSAEAWIGRAFGRIPIPWNRSKTTEGSCAFACAAFVFSWAVLVWMGRGALEAVLLAAPTSLFAAFMESLPWRLDNNLTVPILSALFLAGLTRVDFGRLAGSAPELGRSLLAGLIVNLILGVLFRASGAVDRSGMIAGFFVGALTLTFVSWPGFLVLISFFVLGTASTHLGLRRKQRLEIAQEKKGARSASHALANCGVAVYLAFLVAATASPDVFRLAFVCAYATAAFDTVSGEIGRAYGGRPVLITTLRRVPAGTNGAVSWLGTFAGVAASAVVCAVATLTGFLDGRFEGIVLAAAFVGSTADSLMGATLESRGLMDNEAVNFSNTLVGSLGGIALLGLFGR